MHSSPTSPAPQAGFSSDEERRLALGRRNLRALSLTSLLTDLASSMVSWLLPLYLTGTLGQRASVVGLIEGTAAAIAGLVRIASGWLSDRWQRRKLLVIAGYSLSALSRPWLAAVMAWPWVAALRWSERVGKGLRTAPRDALLAAGVSRRKRGQAFGLHRAADSAGAALGLVVAMAVVAAVQGGAASLDQRTFAWVAILSVLPALAAVVVLMVGVRDLQVRDCQLRQSDLRQSDVRQSEARQSEQRARRGATREAPDSTQPARDSQRGLGSGFYSFLILVALFELGHPAEAFLVLRAAERGLGVLSILAMMLCFTVVRALSSTPGGQLGDRWGRRRVLALGWLLYALLFWGLAAADSGWQVVLLVCGYGLYLGLTQGTVKALVADLVSDSKRGTAYGWLAATVAITELPASLLAGVLWHGVGSWPGLGPAASFGLGATTAALCGLILLSPALARSLDVQRS